MNLDWRLDMARELGYMLAVTARWRQQEANPSLPPLSIWSFASSPRLVGRRAPKSRSAPRVIRSLDINSRAKGQTVIRFARRQRNEWCGPSGAGPPLKKVTTVGRTTMETGRARCFMIERTSALQSERVCEEEISRRQRDDGNDDEESSDASDMSEGNGDEPMEEADEVVDPHSLKDPLLPDPVDLTRRFVDGLSKKLSKVDSSMIMCADDILYIHELIVAWDMRRLRYLISRFHDFHVLMTWPAGWVFTVVDQSRSPRLQKVSAAVTRDGHLCCSAGILSVGVVHDLSRDADTAEYPVIVVDRDGYVYMYDDGGIVPVLHLLTKCGFADFCRRGLRERCGAGMDVGSTPVDYGEEPLSSLLAARGSVDELARARDRVLGSEVAIFHSDDMWTVLRVSDLAGLEEFDESDLEGWQRESGHLRLETIFAVKACVGGVWVVSPVLVSDTGTVFYVDPNDRRIRFLAADLYSFLVLGVMRFRNSSCFPRGTFSTPPEIDVRSLPKPGLGTLVRPTFASRPVFCPRGKRCRRKRLTWTGRVWRWLLSTWEIITGCCRG